MFEDGGVPPFDEYFGVGFRGLCCSVLLMLNDVWKRTSVFDFSVDCSRFKCGGLCNDLVSSCTKGDCSWLMASWLSITTESIQDESLLVVLFT